MRIGHALCVMFFFGFIVYGCETSNTVHALAWPYWAAQP